MGFTFYAKTREELIADKTKDNAQARCLEHRIVGSVLWAAWEILEPRPEGAPDRLIVCTLMETSRDLYGRGNSPVRLPLWGGKDIDETMGPFFYDCPRSMLDLTDGAWWETQPEWATRWRRAMKEGATALERGLKHKELCEEGRRR